METSQPSFLRNPFLIAATLLVLLGVYLRVVEACSSTLWIDEAESGINGLTILERGFPASSYLGEPIYENTLSEPFPESEEYEFRDSSYSSRGFAVYHGWLPFYAIAAGQTLCGIKADKVQSEGMPPVHGREDIFLRTIAPRLPSLFFSCLYLIVVYLLVQQVAGPAAGLTSLTWLAIGSKAVIFGYQARYYSLTLLMSALCALVVWRLYKRGRFIDYVLFGIVEALLFHTHHLSAVVFAVTSLALVPRICQQPNWFLKSALACAIAALLTVPWAIFTGYFNAISVIPKGYMLFDSFSDWTRYFTDRPIILGLLGVTCGLLVFTKWVEKRGWKRQTAVSRNVFAAMVFIGVWIVVAIAAFHLLVPAPSFVLDRLSLILITPVALLLGVAVSEYYPKQKGLQLVAGILVPICIIYGTRHVPRKPPSYASDEIKIACVIEFLEREVRPQPFRMYATYSNHLMWKYYSGLPIQSIAPVRRSFLESYPHAILYLDNSWLMTYPDNDDIRNLAAEEGIDLGLDEVQSYWTVIATELIAEDLHRWGLDNGPFKNPDLPPYLRTYLDSLKQKNLESLNYWITHWKNQIIFKDLESVNLQDLWLSYYYRFIDYPNRIGKNTNILPILQQSEISILPEAGIIAYFREAQ